MSSTNHQPEAVDDIKELASKIQQFLSHQVETNTNLSEAAKESLVVATECIEQAYGIQRKPASNNLLDTYKASKSTQTNSTHANQDPADPAQFISNIASTIFSQVGPSLVETLAGGVPGMRQPQRARRSGPVLNADAPSQSQATPKTRKKVTEAEAMAAESFKNQGNDCMKQDKFKEAYDYYTQAIEIDNGNAIYYSNRAAASSKLGDHQAALRDCQESIEIDPNYSKAYNRMGIAYASLENHQKAKEAYVKAVELDPTNESYRNNLAIAEEKLVEAQNAAEGAGAAGGQGEPNMMNMFRSMISNPDVLSMAMRSLSDPRIQTMLGTLGNAASGGSGAGSPGAGAGSGASGGSGSAPR